MSLFNKIRQYIKFWLLAIFIAPVFLWINSTNAAGDILQQITEPSSKRETILNLWENIETVWNTVFNKSNELNIWEWSSFFSFSRGDSMVTNVIKILLMLTITLSITMILYNGTKYIIEVWNWKDGKSLMKNVAFIVIWILVAIFSVTILNLMRSVPKTLHDELWKGEGQQQDTGAM